MGELNNITFKRFVENCEALKSQYQEIISPFFNIKMARCWKTMIYSLEMEEWKRDKIWEYLNDDLDEKTLQMLIGNYQVRKLDK